MDTFCGYDLLGAEEWFPAPTLSAVRGGVATIKRGMKGDSVMYVQGLAGAIADSKFGDDTEKAVKAFQKSRSLPATGVVDFSTLMMLDVLAQGGTAGVEKIDFSKPSSPSTPTKPPALVFEPDIVTLPSASKSVALVRTAAGAQSSWWMQPAWVGGMERWKVATAGAGGALGLVAILALLFSGGKTAWPYQADR